MKRVSTSILGVIFVAFPFGFALAQTPESQMTGRVPTPIAFPVSPATAGENVSVVPVPGTINRVGKDTLTVRLVNSCFGTNLRSVSNPVSPDGSIEATLTLEAAGTETTLKVVYPGNVVALVRRNDEVPLPLDDSGLPPGSRAVAYGPVVEIQTPVDFSASLSTEGVTRRVKDRLKVKSSAFNQIMHGCPKTPVYGPKWQPTYPCGSYMGKSGPLSANVSPAIVAPDNTAIQIPVAFPGQNGFCGGFYSPLMVFFSDERPQFTAVSGFALNSMGTTAWPEAGAPGHFIAFDRDGNGQIDSAKELFGDGESQPNGFEALRAEDSNKDGQINSKDNSFAQLVLWHDLNGDGKSSKDEMVPLRQKIKSISLKYETKLRPIGRHAEEREVSIARTPAGRKVKVVDVWLAPRVKD